MSNHVHMIIGRQGDTELQGILRDLKKFTSVKIITDISRNMRESRRSWMVSLFEKAGTNNPSNTRFQFWQHGSHPLQLYTYRIADQKLNYIHQNPVKAGIVRAPEDYLYSSAVNYAGRPETLIDVILL
jgi:REP element-mobilizing transposase RayT